MGHINLCFNGCSQDDIRQRRAYAKYLQLSTVLGWRLLSIRVLKRFPTIDHVVKAGVMNECERKLIEASSKHMQWLLPLQWIERGLADGVMKGKIPAPIAAQTQRALGEYLISFWYIIASVF